MIGLDASSLAAIDRYVREVSGLPVKALKDNVWKLHCMFTRKTPFIPNYMDNHNLRQAYAAYHTPMNVIKLLYILNEMRIFEDLRARKNLSVLDFGCGPGSGLLALNQFFSESETKISMMAVDRSRSALEDVRRFHGFLQSKISLSTMPAVPAMKFDVVIAMNVLDEPGNADFELQNYLAERGYLIVVNPGVKEETLQVMRLRDRLSDSGLKICAPCLFSDHCPMLLNNKMWCNMELQWERPEIVRLIDRALNFRDFSIKFSYFVATDCGKGLSDNLPRSSFRIVYFVRKEKGKLWTYGCAADGTLKRIELLRKHRTENHNAFIRAKKGQKLGAELENKGDLFRLKPDSKVDDYGR